MSPAPVPDPSHRPEPHSIPFAGDAARRRRIVAAAVIAMALVSCGLGAVAWMLAQPETGVLSLNRPTR